MINLTSIRGRGTVRAPASQQAINAVRSALGTLPAAIEELLQSCDGFYLENGLKVYSTEEMQERNETYELEESARDYVLVGDDSGGSGFLMHRLIGDVIYRCDLGFLGADYFHNVSNDFRRWIGDGCPMPEDDVRRK